MTRSRPVHRRLGRLARLLLLGAALVVFLGAASPAAAEQRSNAITAWIELELDAIASHRVNPPRASRALAPVSRAMYEASLETRRCRESAIAGAAATVLAYLFPTESARIDALAGRPTRCPARAAARRFAVGVSVGRAMIARAESDGSAASWTGTPPTGDGYWVPTPPGFVYPPLEPLAGTWRMWNLRSGSQFRPPPPPAYGSPRFLAETLEVYLVSRSLTDEQRRIADYWADGAGTVTPSGHWNVIALELVRNARFGLRRTAQLFSALNTAQADSFIAAWDAKYTYWSLRPATAIRALIDPAWTSYIVTPPFPSYVSGHSTTSGAAATVLGAFFPRRAAELAAMAREAAVSRLYGGIHFRSDNEAGLALGRRVGRVAIRVYGLERR